ncbi:MAG: [protein-PII] uridylyltransferase, partial [Beijerinckiaceae bacterium]
MSSVIVADSENAGSRRRARPMQPSAARAAIIDRDALEARIEALVAKTGDAAAQRTLVLEEFRTALELGRAKTRQIFEADGQGLACASNLCHIEDELIRAIFHYVTTALYPNRNPTSGERIAISAVGGYGRGTLAPGSDIDLLFLIPYKLTAWSESVIEAVLYMLWDLGQKVGHSTRSVDECIVQARGDMTIRTALLEARLILGDRALFSELDTQFDKQIVRKTAREFVAAKLSERDARVAKAGSSRYLVEPNVKEGKGGLRDLHTLFWIARYVYRVDTPGELVAAGLFDRQELRTYHQCEEFLWRVRCHLHFEAGRPEERLTFDYQRVIAERLGYVTHAGLSAVERFMKHYFLVAKDVGDLTAIVCAELEESQTKSRPALDRFVSTLRRRRKLEHPDFKIEYDRITFVNDGIFENDPVNLIRMFWLADKYELAIHPDAVQQARRSLRRINADVRNDADANAMFLDILTSRKSPETVLRHMNEAGVLGKFIPDFGRVVAMMQFNMYHHYTVDEHTLRCIGILSRIEAGKLKEDHPLSTEVMPQLQNRRILYVALFLHDIAKGREEDHSIAGAAVARKLCPRLGMTRAETETVAWLVLHHLDMPNIAQGRDLSDRGT